MSPHGGLAFLVVHSPHSTSKNPSFTPIAVPIHQLSFPQPAQPKEWDHLSLPRSPSAIPTSL
jgi:hypothetical protein